MIVKNIYNDVPSQLNDELFEEIISNDKFILERIISEGQATPENFWYDQDKNEFVLLLSGSAEISFEDEPTVLMKAGDYIIIPPHKKHRVAKTNSDKKTFWIALHF